MQMHIKSLLENRNSVTYRSAREKRRKLLKYRLLHGGSQKMAVIQ